MEDFDEDFEYCGDCPVCREPVDHSDAGFCKQCGNPFHWHECGGWHNGNHVCSQCQESERHESKEWLDMPKFLQRDQQGRDDE